MALLEFKAGKMHMNGTTVTADARKGLVSIRNVRLREGIEHVFIFGLKSGMQKKRIEEE